MKVTKSDDYKNYEDDPFQLLPPELAGALIGGIICALIAYDLKAFIAWITG
jgi:hypothetical protein